MPVYIDIWAGSLAIPNDSTIKYAYGKMDMKAIGSHIRHNAAAVSKYGQNRELDSMTHPARPSAV
jgi:hypothetical protein